MTSPLSQVREAALARAQARELSRNNYLRDKENNAQPRRSVVELKQLVAEGNALLSGDGIGSATEADAQQVIAWLAENFRYSTAVACSMADAVLVDLVAKQLPWVDVLFLDTGYHFPETYGTKESVAIGMPVTIQTVLPAQTVAEQDATHGKDLFRSNPSLCCQLRKVEPLSASLTKYEVWVTGVRRDEADTRAETPLISWDEKNGLIKVNPVAAWSFEDLVSYAEQEEVILNPLLLEGYPSIGCQPCTAEVKPGEDPRSGRWAGQAKTECGLHL